MSNFLNQSVALTGAYGRTYKTAKAAMEDWAAGKDFRLDSGPYCSIRDLPAMKQNGTQFVSFMYGPGNSSRKKVAL